MEALRAPLSGPSLEPGGRHPDLPPPDAPAAPPDRSGPAMARLTKLLEERHIEIELTDKSKDFLARPATTRPTAPDPCAGPSSAMSRTSWPPCCCPASSRRGTPQAPVALQMASLIAGPVGGDQGRLKAVLKEITDSEGQIILFIDELHTLVGVARPKGPWTPATC